MSRMIIIYLSYFVLLFLSISCNDSSTEPHSSITSGKYNYSAFDNKDNLVASGYFIISINDSIVSGLKNIQDVGSEHQPESGEGSIHGRIIEFNQIEVYLMETGGPILAIYGDYNNKTIDGSRIYWSATGAWVDTHGEFESKLLE